MNKQRLEINMDKYAPGIYFINLNKGKNNVIKRLILK